MLDKSYNNFGNTFVFDADDRPRSLTTLGQQEAIDEQAFQKISSGSILSQVADLEYRTGRTVIKSEIVRQVVEREKITGVHFLKFPGIRR